MKKLMGLCSLLLLLIGCEEKSKIERESQDVVKEAYMKEIIEVIKNSELAPYISSDVQLVEAVPDQKESLIFFYFTFKAELNNQFASLSDQKKYDLFKGVTGTVFNKSCSQGYNCSVPSIKFKSNTDIYDISLDYVFSVDKNGDNFNPKATSSAYSSVDEEKVYEYMKSQYNRLTNYGANYVPEIHDPQVASLASEKFGISTDRADKIYIFYETNGN